MYSHLDDSASKVLKDQLEGFYNSFKETLTDFEKHSSSEKSSEEPNEFDQEDEDDLEEKEAQQDTEE